MSTRSPASQTSDLTNTLRSLSTEARELGREDLATRLDGWVERLSEPKVRVVVVGPFNQGKSTLINTVIGAPVCPVDDIAMTAIPIIIEYGENPGATLVFDVPGEDRSTQIPIDINDLRKHVMDHVTSTGSLDGGKIHVAVPAETLRSGLVLVDTPGVGGAVARHAVTTLAMLPTADALVVLSDASQELTEPELSFLRQASKICPIVMSVLSKTDLTPHWREVEAANRQHLKSADIDAAILPVSANLHRTALSLGDTDLADESGIPRLVERLQRDLLPRAVASLLDAASAEATAVSTQLSLGLQAELETLVRPGEATMLVQTFEDAQAVAADLNKRASRWQIALNDGFNDLVNDVEYDVRDRVRSVGRDAEQLVDESDPADTWETMTQWLADAFAEAIADSFVWAYERCEHVATNVAESFRHESEIRLPQIPSIDTSTMMKPVAGIDFIRTSRMTGSQKLIGAMRGSYSGILMAGIITTLAGMALINPISVLAGAVLGGFSLRQEGANRLERRRNEARNAIRRAVDETIFHVVKETRTSLTEVKRLMRAEFEDAADDFRQSLNLSVESARRGAGTPAAHRDARTQALTEHLQTVRELATSAQTASSGPHAS
ncbi:MAG: dynamin family protein [Aeromicrobium sp.]